MSLCQLVPARAAQTFRCAVCGRVVESRQADPARIHVRCRPGRRVRKEGRKRRTKHPAIARHDSTCQHRGAAVETVACQLCGDRGKLVTIYACQVHTSCTLRRWSDRPTPHAICLGCPSQAP